MKKLFSVLAVIFLPLAVLAQHQVSGKVTEAVSGEPLMGVGILVPGTTVGTVTDLDGVYSLSVPENATLSFEYIGYTTVVP